MNPLLAPSSVASALMQGAAQEPADPFVWGQGSARLSPDDIARRRAIADQQTMGDYSPVGHWTQGLGRVLDGFTGGMEQRRLDTAQADNQAARQESIAALGLDPTIAGALSSGDPVAQAIAEQMLKAQMASPELSTDEKLLRAAGFTPGTPEYQAQAQALINNKGDPFITASLPGGGFYGGPQSGFMTALTGGGDPVSMATPPVDWTQAFSPEELAVMQNEAARRQGSANIPQGSPLQGGPAVGAVIDGYRFKGGNPNDRSSWVEVR